MNMRLGQSLIELLLTIGLMAILLPALLVGLFASHSGRAQTEQQIQASTQLQAMQEEMRSIREGSWASIATDGTFYPYLSGTTWTLASGSAIVNGFTNQVTISDVYRNANGDIVASGGIIDPSTKAITAAVSWNSPYISSIQSIMYLTRYLRNTSFLDTTVSDFSAGTQSNTSVVPSTGSGVFNDGQVQLGSTAGAGAGPDWCSPNLSISPLDLPGQGITTAISATTSADNDSVFTTTGGNSSGDSMDGVSISHSYPPVATNISAYNNFKSYGIYDQNNQYVYLTSDHPNLTVDIVQVTLQPYSEVGTFNASGGGGGSSVFVSYNPSYGHDVGYVTAGSALYTFDLTSKSGARTQLGSVTLGGTGKKIMVVGNYAYVVISDSNEQLDVVNVSDPTHLSVVSKANVNNNQPGQDLFVNSTGTRVYLVTTQASTNVNDFFIINTSNLIPTLPVPLGSFNTGTMNPYGVAVVQNDARAIIVGSGGEQYKVLDISTEASPTRCGGLTNPNGSTAVNAIATVNRADGTAYSYILTNSASEEFQIIAGGSGVVNSANGTFTSRIFDATASSGFNNILATVSQPANTSIKVQLAVAAPVNGSCSGVAYTFVGPNLDPSEYFTPVGASISASIPFGAYGASYTNPGRCYRYKALLSTFDSSQTPILYDISTNYSP